MTKVTRKALSFAVLASALAPLTGCLAAEETGEPTEANEQAIAGDQILTHATLLGAGTQTKNVTSIKFTPAKVTIGVGMGKASLGPLLTALETTGISVVGSDAAGARKRVSWDDGQLASLQLPALSAGDSTPLVATMTFEQVDYGDAPLGVDVTYPESTAVGFRVRMPGVDPARVIAVRSSMLTTPDGGDTWQGTLEVDVTTGAELPLGRELRIDYLSASGQWLSGVELSSHQPLSSVKKSGVSTVTMRPSRISLLTAP
jgi:hypothetical protein